MKEEKKSIGVRAEVTSFNSRMNDFTPTDPEIREDYVATVANFYDDYFKDVLEHTRGSLLSRLSNTEATHEDDIFNKAGISVVDSFETWFQKMKNEQISNNNKE